MTPALEAQRFLWAAVLGLGLGLVYGFLRPLRPRALADLLFVGAAFYAWLVLSFQVCRGDIRLGPTAGLFVGAFLWEATAGRLLRPVFRKFWHIIWKILGVFSWPVRKICIIFRKFRKFLLAEAKKWVTIRKDHFRPDSPDQGGVTRGRKKLPRKAALRQEQPPDHRGSDCRHRPVHSRAGGPAISREQR